MQCRDHVAVGEKCLLLTADEAEQLRAIAEQPLQLRPVLDGEIAAGSCDTGGKKPYSKSAAGNGHQRPISSLSEACMRRSSVSSVSSLSSTRLSE